MPGAAVLAGAALALRGCPPSSAHPASAIAPASASTIVLVARMPLTPLISRAEHPARPALCQSDNTPRIGPILGVTSPFGMTVGSARRGSGARPGLRSGEGLGVVDIDPG